MGRTTILMTGATGRVGRLLHAAWRRGEAQHLDLVSTARRPDASVDLVWGLGNESIGRALTRAGRARPDTMFALAGVVPGPSRDLGANVELARRQLRAAEEAGIRRVLLASSSAVYGVSGNDPIREDAMTDPANAYGAAKLDMERMAEAWRDRLEICCLRVGNVLGADALLDVWAVSTDGRPIRLDRFPSGGGPVRSYVDPAVLLRILHSLATTPGTLPPHLNVAAPRPVSMAALLNASGRDWQWHGVPSSPAERITLDCNALASLHAFEPDASDAEAMIRRLDAVKESLHD